MTRHAAVMKIQKDFCWSTLTLHQLLSLHITMRWMWVDTLFCRHAVPVHTSLHRPAPENSAVAKLRCMAQTREGSARRLTAASRCDALEITIEGLCISHAVEKLCHNPKRQQHLRLAQHTCMWQLPSTVNLSPPAVLRAGIKDYTCETATPKRNLGSTLHA